MTAIFKYEFIRRKRLFLGALISIICAEGAALTGIYLGSGWTTLAIVMSLLIGVGGLLLAMLDTIVKLYSDFKNKQGLMLFMTPKSGYSIIWGKTLFGILEITVAAAAIYGCFVLSGAAVDNVYDGAFTRVIEEFGVSMGPVLIYASVALLEFFAQLAIAILAVTVAKAMTRGGSFKWFIALLMYIALAVGVNTVDSLLLVAFGLVGDAMTIVQGAGMQISEILVKYLIIGAATYTAWFMGCTLISGRIVNRGVDL